MTLNPNWFLNATGQFTPIGSGQIALSTTTTTGFLTYVTSTSTVTINLNTTATTFDGPFVTQGTSGVWLAFGSVTISDSAAPNQTHVKLWDGTTVIASGEARVTALNVGASVLLSGIISNPASNLKVSMVCNTATGIMLYNFTPYLKDCYLTAIRIG